jgi:hypothetical protein
MEKANDLPQAERLSQLLDSPKTGSRPKGVIKHLKDYLELASGLEHGKSQ